jgi:hypothetical protein
MLRINRFETRRNRAWRYWTNEFLPDKALLEKELRKLINTVNNDRKRKT